MDRRYDVTETWGLECGYGEYELEHALRSSPYLLVGRRRRILTRDDDGGRFFELRPRMCGLILGGHSVRCE